MTSRKTGVLAALLATLTVVAAVTAATAPAAIVRPDRDRVGVRRQGQHGPVRRARRSPRRTSGSSRSTRGGGVNGRKLRIITCDTQNNAPAKAKSCAASLIGKGADIMFVTCDVDYATPVVQEAINRGILAIAPCIGTDQMGPKRFGTKGRLAFSFGNVAQDEGSAMAEFAWKQGWKTAALATNTLLVYFKNVVQAFEARFTQLGGKVVAQGELRDGCQQREHRRQPAERRQGGRDRHVDRVRRAAGARVGSPLAREPDPDPQLVGR